MGKLQELLATLLPDAWAASMEDESRAWRMRCPCGEETSIWEMGGVRWKAAGQPRRLGKCGACGREFLGAVYRDDAAATTTLTADELAVEDTILETPTMSSRSMNTNRTQCLLWIDGVGCWMLHLRDRISIGGPGVSSRGDRSADLQLLADLSRSHATVARSGEVLLLAPDGPASVSENPVTRPTVLRDGDVVGLGSAVRLRFRQPSALSLTARLEFLSDHRPERRIDGALMMDQACILGPGADCHVVCPEWEQRIIVFRRDGKLWCKRGGSPAQAPAEDLYVNGCRVNDAAPLRDGTIVTLGDSRFRIEMPVADFV